MENNNSPQKEIVVVKQKSGCLTKFVLMLVALLLIIILFPALCGIGILGGLAGAGSLCAISQSTVKRDVKYSKPVGEKKIEEKQIDRIKTSITPYPEKKLTSKKNIVLKSNKSLDTRTSGGYVGRKKSKIDVRDWSDKKLLSYEKIYRNTKTEEGIEILSAVITEIIKRDRGWNKKTIPTKVPEVIKKMDNIQYINDDFTFRLGNNKTIRFENILWNQEKSEEIKQYLNQLKGRQVRIYYYVEKTSSMGDYRIKKDSKNNLLIKDIRYQNNSILDELRENELIF